MEKTYLSDIPIIEFHFPINTIFNDEYEIRGFYDENNNPHCELVKKQYSESFGKSCFVIAYLTWGRDVYEGSDIVIVGDRWNIVMKDGINEELMKTFHYTKKAMDSLVIAKYESKELDKGDIY